MFFITPGSVLGQVEEYKMKAVAIEKISKFIEWPNESETLDTTKEFIISVIGENPFGNLLEEIYKEYNIKNLKAKIEYVSDISENSKCHLLFISESENKRLEEIISYTKNRAILTMSETDGFASRGVLINLFISGNKIRFEINETGMDAAGFKVSYLILRIAKIIYPLGGE